MERLLTAHFVALAVLSSVCYARLRRKQVVKVLISAEEIELAVTEYLEKRFPGVIFDDAVIFLDEEDDEYDCPGAAYKTVQSINVGQG